jgi:hypothetical protein
VRPVSLPDQEELRDASPPGQGKGKEKRKGKEKEMNEEKENLSRTPENVIWDTLRIAGTEKLSHNVVTDRIMRALADAGFTVEDALNPAGKTYSRDDVSQAVNAGANLVTGDPGIYMDEGRDWSLVNLVVNAALSLLDDPGMSLDEVIRANWQERDEEGNDITVEEVRSWVA